jgi:NlpC/P60 family putative phage cell wall peptidase
MRDSETALAARAVAAARAWIGTPYRHQASVRGVGADCLGLVRGVYRDLFGVEPEDPPPYGAGWAEAGGLELLAEAAARHLAVDERDLLGGEVLLFRWRPGFPARHAGIAASPRTMVHAQSGAAVCEIPLGSWWLRRLAFVYRFRTA